ncbi:conserved hypothetical protein [Phenylobacterium zucineum HLK1]|uniref:DUF3422 domain-containing protein n=2 Tax=Phenylobacterium zucineum TaxID=284016 RepID=B4RGD8_PHEZH|nr:conserved hypothetical protein [Phenylobacterium zucineum HLK1]
MHLRKLPGVRPPARALQAVLVASDTQLMATARLLRERAKIEATGGARYLTWREGQMSVAWERHTEFMTLTFLWEGAGRNFEFEGVEAALELLLTLPGEVLRASKIHILGPDCATPADADLGQLFSADDLVICDVADGRARIWSDFRLHDDGFGRLLIADRGLQKGEPALLLQRLQELGNYRKMALIGLPVAQAANPAVAELEQRLADLTKEMSVGSATDDTILADLLELSADLARLSAETRHRMSATRAYAQLCAERLRQLRVSPVAGYRSLEDFTERRLSPAARTCAAFTVRLDDLSRQAGWASALLRTRIDTRLAGQQRDLLASMDRRTDLQLRLQHMVEWVSAAAVAYYLVGLLHYAVAPFDHVAGLQQETVLALASPAALVAVVLVMHAFARRFRRPANGSSKAGNS